MVKMIRNSFFILLFTITSYASTLQCDTIVKYFNIDKEIKSVKGWKRVCRNKKIVYYIYNVKNYTNKDIDDLCKCLIKNDSLENRTIDEIKE